MTLRELLRTGQEMLEDAGIEAAGTDAWLLFEFVTGMSRSTYFMEMNREANASEDASYMDVIRRRMTHYPLQYITHSQAFYGLDFYVDERVLIPRQDTEILVETALRYLKDGMKVLDMCTGSGCILISLASERKLSEGCGVDLSEGALEVAAGNANRHGLATLKWLRSSLFEALTDAAFFDLDMIVSNPPYIASEVIPTLMPEVRSHEPMMALDGKADGLYFYREITAQAAQRIRGGGYLVFEIGYDQADAVSQMLKTSGFSDVTVVKDLAGLDRVVYGRQTRQEAE